MTGIERSSATRPTLPPSEPEWPVGPLPADRAGVPAVVMHEVVRRVSEPYRRFRLYLSNTSWILAEKFLRLGIGLAVSVAVARHLGPDRFGILSYAVSIAAVFGAAGHLGLAGIVIRDLVREPERRPEILGTAFALKGGGVALGTLLLFALAWTTETSGSESFWVVSIAALSLIALPTEVIDFWFQAHVRARATAIARTGAVIVGAGVKLALVVGAAGVILFAAAHLVQALLTGLFLLLMYSATGGATIREWAFSATRAKDLLRQGWMVFLGTLFAFIYLKIDQVMLRWLAGAEEVGIYAVAATLSETWYFVPPAIVASVFPRLIELHGLDSQLFAHRLQQLCDVLLLVAVTVAVVVTVVSAPVIRFLYGEAFSAAAVILSIHIWAGIFIFLRAVFSKWIIIENVLIFSLVTQGMGAIANVGLNLLLIPSMGGRGAAIATIISYAMASYVSLLFYRRTRPVFWIMTRSLVAPVRWPFRLIQRWAG